MFSKLDHITLAAPDIEEAIENYETIFGYPSHSRTTDASGVCTNALFKIGETALKIVSPPKNREGTFNKVEFEEQSSGRVSSYAFATDNIEETHRVIKRRGLDPTEIVDQEYFGQQRRKFTCKNVNMSVDVDAIESVSNFNSASEKPESEIQSLDHLVVDTPNVDRALATYGARMGFRLALERNAPEWKVHFLFFRIGSITFEVVHRFGVDHQIHELDRPFGFSWATRNIEQTQERLAASGCNVSEIRVGRRPGSRVFTLRDRTCGVPTLFIEHKLRDSAH